MGAGVEAAQAAAWLGAAPAVPSGQDAVDLWGTLEQDPQPHSSPGRLLVPSS